MVPARAGDWGGPLPVRGQFPFELPLLASTPEGARLLPPGGLRLDLLGVQANTVQVTDDGSPPKGDSKTFQVTVTDYAELNVGQAIIRTARLRAIA